MKAFYLCRVVLFYFITAPRHTDRIQQVYRMETKFITETPQTQENLMLY